MTIENRIKELLSELESKTYDVDINEESDYEQVEREEVKKFDFEEMQKIRDSLSL